MLPRIIHIFGASGSGTTTLASEISARFGYFHMDTDDYFWLPTNPMFIAKREKSERLALMKKDIEAHEKIVISGSLCDWGDELIPCFDLAIRVVTDTETRLQRLKDREYRRFGERIREGGDMYEEHIKFLTWASEYDTGDIMMRSKAKHDEWQKQLLCPVIMVDGAEPIEKIFLTERNIKNMKEKVIIMSIDGMRPDGLKQCGNEYLSTLMEECSYTFDARSMKPSITLPCHMSIFYGIEPMRHGIISNTFVPQVHNVKGLFEKIAAYGGVNAIFYGWEPLRNVAPPESCKFATYINAYTDESVDTILTDAAIKLIDEKKPDFVFLYQVDTDEKGGHDNGWMTDAYLNCISIALDNARRVIEKFGDEYTVIITADHGGHDRMHGTQMPEDMTIPMFFRGKSFEKGKELSGITLLDIAPTVARIMDFPCEKEWGGKAI